MKQTIRSSVAARCVAGPDPIERPRIIISEGLMP